MVSAWALSIAAREGAVLAAAPSSVRPMAASRGAGRTIITYRTSVTCPGATARWHVVLTFAGTPRAARVVLEEC